MPYRVDIVGCADVGGASFANDGLRKLSPSYGPHYQYIRWVQGITRRI